jgi:hypothetical protein
MKEAKSIKRSKINVVMQNTIFCIQAEFRQLKQETRELLDQEVFLQLFLALVGGILVISSKKNFECNINRRNWK